MNERCLKIIFALLGLTLTACEAQTPSSVPTTQADVKAATGQQPADTPSPNLTPVLQVMPTDPANVVMTSLGQNGFSGTWAPSAHSSGINHYDVLLMSGSNVMASATSVTTNTAVTVSLAPGNYAVAVRAVSNSGVNGNYVLNAPQAITTSNVTYTVRLIWQIRVDAGGGNYSYRTCMDTKTLSYAATQTAVNTTYASCALTANSQYSLALNCPLILYQNSTSFLYDVPNYVSKAGMAYVTQGGVFNYEVGTCGAWTPPT